MNDYFDENGDLVWEATELDSRIYDNLIALGILKPIPPNSPESPKRASRIVAHRAKEKD